MKAVAKILIVVTSAVLFAAGCSRGPEVIPKSKMEKICTDLFLADEWLMENDNFRAVVDTSLFYEPIFRKYGYDTEDFRASLEYYMRDPLKFSRMIKKVALKMDTDSRKMKGTPGESALEALEDEENETE